MTNRIQIRRDTATNWTTTNPTLASGEPGFETDTGYLKWGDGVTPWNTLAYQPNTAQISATYSTLANARKQALIFANA